jgi:hypothetical protein
MGFGERIADGRSFTPFFPCGYQLRNWSVTSAIDGSGTTPEGAIETGRWPPPLHRDVGDSRIGHGWPFLASLG